MKINARILALVVAGTIGLVALPAMSQTPPASTGAGAGLAGGADTAPGATPSRFPYGPSDARPIFTEAQSDAETQLNVANDRLDTAEREFLESPEGRNLLRAIDRANFPREDDPHFVPRRAPWTDGSGRRWSRWERDARIALREKMFDAARDALQAAFDQALAPEIAQADAANEAVHAAAAAADSLLFPNETEAETIARVQRAVDTAHLHGQEALDARAADSGTANGGGMSADDFADHADENADAYDKLADGASDAADAARWRQKAKDLRQKAAEARAAAARDKARQATLLRRSSANTVGAAVNVAVNSGIRTAVNGATEAARSATRVAAGTARPRVETPRLVLRVEHRYFN